MSQGEPSPTPPFRLSPLLSGNDPPPLAAMLEVTTGCARVIVNPPSTRCLRSVFSGVDGRSHGSCAVFVRSDSFSRLVRGVFRCSPSIREVRNYHTTSLCFLCVTVVIGGPGKLVTSSMNSGVVESASRYSPLRQPFL